MARKESLTSRQREVYDTIVDFKGEIGYPPTMEELATRLDLSSTNAVSRHLRILEEKGWIRREPNTPRGITIFEQK